MLHAFANAGEGNEPLGGLVMDQSGNLYGMTQLGGNGFGNVFKIAPDGTETVLHTFQGQPEGARPAGELIMDSAGNLYGTTGFGGKNCQHSIFGCGVVFKLEPNGNETVLYAFNQDSGDGIVPDAGLVADAGGNLYGTTLFVSESDCQSAGGAVFKLTPDGNVASQARACSGVVSAIVPSKSKIKAVLPARRQRMPAYSGVVLMVAAISRSPVRRVQESYRPVWPHRAYPERRMIRMRRRFVAPAHQRILPHHTERMFRSA